MSPEERLKLHKPTSPTVDGNGKALTLVDSSSATITTRRGSQITLDNRLAEKHRPRELGPPEEAENQPI